MPDRKKKRRFVYVIAVLVLFVAAAACLYGNRDDIIIRNGIRFYRKLRGILAGTGGVAVLAVLIWYFSGLARYKKQQKDSAAQAAKAQAAEKALREKESHKEVLSVSRKMDSEKIRELLSEYASQKWNALAQPLMQIRMQLDMMDDHQEKLSHLLEANGADGLASTEDVLEQVEQYLCKNVRKVLNYMDVADNDDADDVRMVREKLEICQEEGRRQLGQVQEFLFALAEFLNRQGEDDSSMEMLDIYKTTILASIEER